MTSSLFQPPSLLFNLLLQGVNRRHILSLNFPSFSCPHLRFVAVCTDSVILHRVRWNSTVLFPGSLNSSSINNRTLFISHFRCSSISIVALRQEANLVLILTNPSGFLSIMSLFAVSIPPLRSSSHRTAFNTAVVRGIKSDQPVMNTTYPVPSMPGYRSPDSHSMHQSPFFMPLLQRRWLPQYP